MWIWLPRPDATADLSGLTASARTGVTFSGGAFSTTRARARIPVGGLAPCSIHSLMRASSSGVNGSSGPLGGMAGSKVRPASFTRRLSADLNGTIGLPRLPPFISVS